MAQILMTVNLAADWFGLKPKTVRNWVGRFGLQCQGQTGNAKLYRFEDLCRVDRLTRTSPRLRVPRFGGHTAQ
jgi:DNA-binding transcriptional MerR regulator